jgi:hypothetical protein
VALELEVDWRLSPGPPASGRGRRGSGAGPAQRRRQRAGLVRFEGAGYHADRDAAIARALEAVRGASGRANLALQLERNGGPSQRRIGLSGAGLDSVSSLQQVLAVRQVLLRQLGARTAEIRELRPHGATLQVVSSLGPGALQEKLASVRFDGFALTPEDAGAGRARLRVDAQSAGPETLAPGPPQN